MENQQLENCEQQVLENGDLDAFGQLILHYQKRLERVITFRMDGRLRSRMDATDVLQETFVEATRRIPDFQACQGKMTFFLWLRFLAVQKLNQLHRHHLGVQARDAAREVGIYQYAHGQMTSVVLAAQLLGKMTSPSRAAIREENRVRLEQSLSELDDIDREILALRHFEQLSNSETARLLELSESASSNRYFRAVRRLKAVMNRINKSNSGIFHDS